MKSASAIALLALILALSATSCVIIPTPHYDSGFARNNVNGHAQEQFLPGKTTREDVIVALGEPDTVSRDERLLAYRSEKVVAWTVMGGGYNGAGSAASGAIYKNYFHLFELGPKGLYQTNRQTGQWGVEEGAHWDPKLNLSALSFGSSNEVVVDVSRCGYWLPNVDGFRSKGATQISGESGELMFTETNLIFTSASQFANAGPTLKLALTSISKVYVDKNLSKRRLVVHTDGARVHSFEIVKTNGSGASSQDISAMQAACDYIQSIIKPTRPEP